MIVPTSEQGSGISETLEKRINAVVPNPADRFMLPGKNGCFVSFNGISTELRNKLNLSGKLKSATTSADHNAARNVDMPDDEMETPAVLINVVPGSFNGYALTTIWEWLDLKSKE